MKTNFKLTWWDGDEQAVTNVMTTSATPQQIRDIIEQTQEIEDYMVDDFLYLMDASGHLVEDIPVIEFDF